MELFDSQALRHLRCEGPEPCSASSYHRQVKSHSHPRGSTPATAHTNGMKVRLSFGARGS